MDFLTPAARNASHDLMEQTAVVKLNICAMVDPLLLAENQRTVASKKKQTDVS